ncbi:hypothetical protein [Kitasatospora sp. CB01950]|uniref:hypothetical protein n=1 Tax=Kitasatospora sp. CB01950 TaxID=1703930 RepID=UPI00093CDC5C|nr:hypothetical protein [Kitasatospora sp. CB01950]
MRKNVFRRATAALLGAAAIALTVPTGTASAVPPPHLPSGGKLMPGQYLTGGYEPAIGAVLEMQADGNLVLYLEASVGGHGPAVWSSGTWGHPGAYAYMQEDGNLVVYKQGSTKPSDALWSSGTWGSPGAWMMLSGGRLWLSGSNRSWSTDTGPAPYVTGIPGADPYAVIGPAWGLDPGSWIQSNTVRLVNQPDGNLVLYRRSDGTALWSSGTWGRPKSSLSLSQSPQWPALGLHRIDNGSRTWSTPIKGRSDIYGIVQNDGNFVVYDKNGTALWATGTWGKA